MLGGLVLAQAVIVWSQAFGTWNEIREYLADADLRAAARPFWHHCHVVAVTLANVLLLVGAIAAIVTRREATRSRRWLLLAFALYLPLQILPHFVPLSWHFQLPEASRERADEVLRGSAPLLAVAALVDLVPLAVSIFFGLMRAGLRHATRHPERPIGAVIGFATAAQLGVIVAAGLACTVQSMTTATWLDVSLWLLLGHYALVAVACFLLARRGHERSRWRWVPWISGLVLFLPGIGRLLVGLLDVEVLGQHLIAWGDRQGLVPAGELPGHLVVFLARTTSTAVAANDLLARSGED